MNAFLRAASDAERALHERARAVAEHAYVPYSGFRVGAAIQLADGDVVVGCNVENASYGLTICAERSALGRLVSEGRDCTSITAVAIHVDGADGQPCGACRQVLVELAPTASVTFPHGGGLVTCGVRDLLPAAFVPEALDT